MRFRRVRSAAHGKSGKNGELEQWCSCARCRRLRVLVDASSRLNHRLRQAQGSRGIDGRSFDSSRATLNWSASITWSAARSSPLSHHHRRKGRASGRGPAVDTGRNRQKVEAKRHELRERTRRLRGGPQKFGRFVGPRRAIEPGVSGAAGARPGSASLDRLDPLQRRRPWQALAGNQGARQAPDPRQRDRPVVELLDRDVDARSCPHMLVRVK